MFNEQNLNPCYNESSKFRQSVTTVNDYKDIFHLMNKIHIKW